MAPNDPIASEGSPAGLSTEACPQAAAAPAAPPPKGAHIKAFGPDIGVADFELDKPTVTIGRSEEADIVLPSRSVSRTHATVSWNGDEFVLTDTGSTSGTFVNDVCADQHVLADGDAIRIGGYLLHFGRHHTMSVAEEAAARARFMLRGDFNTLPAIMQARYRQLDVHESASPAAGQTLQMAQSGLLIPAVTAPDESGWLELELTTAGRAPRLFLGQIMGVIPKGGMHWMCVGLHTLTKEQHEAFVAGVAAGPWIDVDSGS